MKIRRLFQIFVLFFLIPVFSSVSFAATEVKAVDPQKAADIQKLLELNRLEEVVMLAANNFLDQFFPILEKSLDQNNQKISETVFAIARATTLSLVKRQVTAKGGLVDRVIPLYDRHYTHEEIRQLIQFYQSPVGQKAASLRPELVRESMGVAESWISFLEPLLVQALARSLKKQGYTIVKQVNPEGS